MRLLETGPGNLRHAVRSLGRDKGFAVTALFTFAVCLGANVALAIGAQPAQIRAQFLGLGARLAAAGAAVGVLGAWLSGQAMEKLLYGVSAVNPLVLGATAGMLALIAMLACLLPALRDARVSPMEALRSE